MGTLDDLNEVLARLAMADPFSYSDRDSIIALERGLSSYSATLAKAAASFAEGGEWAADGAQSPAAWIATTTHLPLGEAQRQLRRGRALASMPLVAQAFSEGRIGPAHVDVLIKAAQAVAHADPEAFSRCEAALLEAATELRFVPFANAVTYFTQMADPDGAEECDLARRARRDAYVVQSLHGMYLLGGHLDPVSGAIVAGELTRIEKLLFEADWASAKEALGRDPKLNELARTPAQRRADALVEMAVRSKGAQATDRRPAPSFSVLVGYEALHGRISQIEGGPIVTPGALLPWLDGASFERIIFGPGTRIECSPIARFFTGATRRAIEIRDQHCTHPFCDVPAARCQIDHIIPYAQGGETTQGNGQLHCGFHNRLRNHERPGDEDGAEDWAEDGAGLSTEADDDLDDEGGP
jgi:uncharacterized protein DUF222/HNH endonuclease